MKKAKRNEKIAIITSGGALKCAYSAGVLAAISQKFKGFKPDVAIGNSGGGGNICYFMTGQIKEMEEIWKDLLLNSPFVSFKRFDKMMDIDYLVDEIIAKQRKLDINKLKKIKSKIFLSATNHESGETRYFSVNDANVLEILRATKAIPVLYNKKVDIQGAKYIDGAISSTVEKSINKAIEEGATKIIVIDNRNFLTRARHYMSNLLNGIEPNTKVLRIMPSKPLPIGLMLGNRESVKETFELGFKDTIENKELEAFINLRS